MAEIDTEGFSRLEKKLDDVLALLHEHDKKIEVHIATDEMYWAKILEAEQALKEAAKEATALKIKHAALVAVISSSFGTGAAFFSRLFGL